MKRLICALLTLALALMALPALADTAQEALAPDGGALIPIEEYPIVDGSTATLPLSYALMCAFTGCTQEEAESTIHHNKTTNSFYYLASNDSDLLLVYLPEQSAYDYLTDNEVPYESKDIGRDALVFLVNAQNPVNDLTQQQVYDIYTGAITNWSAIEGGEDVEITPYQRPASSGSQVMMNKLAVPADAIMEAPANYVLSEMGELIAGVANYDNAASSLGYSVWYYAHNMYALDEVKILTIDGVEASVPAIESGEYPYVQAFYGVIRASEPEDSNARRLYDFLTSEAGQNLVRECGYAGIGAPEAETEAEADTENETTAEAETENKSDAK